MFYSTNWKDVCKPVIAWGYFLDNVWPYLSPGTDKVQAYEDWIKLYRDRAPDSDAT